MKYRKLHGYKYETLEVEVVYIDIKVRAIRSGYIDLWENGGLVIKERYAWDGATGAIDTKNFMMGSLVHDALYQLMREGLLNRKHRKQADKELRKICLKHGMNKLRAWYVYRWVRASGKKSSMPRKNPRGEVIEI